MEMTVPRELEKLTRLMIPASSSRSTNLPTLDFDQPQRLERYE